MGHQDLQVIIGLGATGLSVADYFAKKGIPFAVTDSRQKPPKLAEFMRAYPDVQLSVGQLDDALLDKASRLIVSPGLSLQHPSIMRQIADGKPVIGDIELFAEATNVPVIAITGTNAKSTVTTLVGEMAKTAGLHAVMGGNLGIPALQLLDDPAAELFVLELSSFQLEATFQLRSRVASVLNVTPDHMDRYATLDEYAKTKRRIYMNCQVAVCNRDDPLTHCDDDFKNQRLFFTLNEPGDNEFGLLKKQNEVYLAFEDKLLMPVRELPVLGRHYQANALAALAMGHGFGLSMASMLKTLSEFKGLPHRCQLVRERSGVYWYNDSKGTNVGATLAAIEGLGSEMQGKIILIAGGVGKNADFSPLVMPIEKYVKSVILIGEAAPILAAVIGDRVNTQMASSMEEAVTLCDRVAKSGDSVLLSPACASLDMFNNFEHRGNVFASIVQML